MTKVTWRETLPIWWSFAWRSLIFGLLAGFLLGVAIGFLAATFGNVKEPPAWALYSGFLIGLAASVYAMKQAIGKHAADIAVIHKRSQFG